MNFKEFLNEGSKGKETAKIIRELLKKELGLGTKDVSVTSSRDSVDVQIKTIKALEVRSKIESIGEKYKKVIRDEMSQEILSGNNLFVFTSINSQLETSLFNIIKKEVDEQFTDIETGKLVKLFNILNIKKEHEKVYFVQYKNEIKKEIIGKDRIAREILYYVLSLDDEKVISKIK